MKQTFNQLLRLFNRNKKQVYDKTIPNSDFINKDNEIYNRIQSAAKPLNQQKFEPYFAERVMQRIQTKTVTVQDMFFDSLKMQFRPLAYATGAVMVLLMTYNMLTEKTFSVNQLLPTSSLTYEEAMDPSLAYFGE